MSFLHYPIEIYNRGMSLLIQILDSIAVELNRHWSYDMKE